MPKLTKELSAIEVKRLIKPGRHPVGTVPGLYLWVRETGTKNWVMRAMVNGKRSDIGLGGYPAVSLADALKRARELREGIAKGLDPLAKKKADKAVLMTFTKAAEEYIKLHRPSWKNAKHANQWESTLTTYVYPEMGTLPIKDVETPHVLAVIQPYWNTKNETMVRVRNRIELILSWAMAAGHRERGLNPATWRGHLDQALPKPSRVNGRTHHPALPWQELPALIYKLKTVEGMSARCLEFTILTACRSGEARGATWDEINFKDRIWNIPANRMKAGKAHRVPLSDESIKLLSALPRMIDEQLIFSGQKENTSLSDMSLTMLLRRHSPGITVHGFRSTFRDWAAETTNYPNEVCEMALSHAVGDSVEAAYRRSDLFAKRSALMMDWANFATALVTGSLAALESNVA